MGGVNILLLLYAKTVLPAPWLGLYEEPRNMI